MFTCAALAGAVIVFPQTPLFALLGGFPFGRSILILLASLLLVPLLLQAWCPLAARAAGAALQVRWTEVALPSFARFLGRWLVLCIVIVLLVIVGLFLPDMAQWLLLVPAAMALSALHVRCALCLYANQEQADAVAASTQWRRTFLWTALCAVPSLLLEAAGNAILLSGGLASFGAQGGATFIAIKLLTFLLGMAIVLPVWAALSLGQLQEMIVRAGAGKRAALGAAAAPAQGVPAAPARGIPVARAKTSRPARLLMAAIGCVAVVLVGAYAQRSALLDYHLRSSDPVYAKRYRAADGEFAARRQLEKALGDYACDANAERVDYLMRKGVKPPDGKFDSALLCAGRKGNIAAVVYLLGKGANVDASPTPQREGDYSPLTSLQMAVDRSDDAMVRLLLERRADPSRRSAERGGDAYLTPLQMAAAKRDFAIVRLLVDANATTAENEAQPPIFHAVQGALKDSAGAPVGWEALLTEALGAGLALDALDRRGASLLHWAAGQGHLDLVHVLFLRQFDSAKRDLYGAIPLMQLLAWYDLASDREPGPELEVAMKELSRGLQHANASATVEVTDKFGKVHTLNDVSIADVAARRPRVAAMFGLRQPGLAPSLNANAPGGAALTAARRPGPVLR